VAARDKPRERSLEILQRVEAGAPADVLIERARRVFNERDSAFILELVYGTLRNRTKLDWALDRLSTRPVAGTDASTRNILRLGAYQMLFLDRVPASAAVNTATELAKAHGKKSGYVNGLLRNLARKRGGISFPGPGDDLRRLAVLYSHPEWLVRRWIKRFGAETTEKLLESNNRPAPLVIRTNALKATREELKASLADEGAVSVETAYSPLGLEIVSGPGLRELASFRSGRFIVQDEAAQLISMILAPRPGENALDACAAPGGKATHLAELMEDRGRVVALENDLKRIERIRDNSARLGLTSVVPTPGDAAAFRERGFDRVLVDAPCSGIGVLRRHPDGRWSKSEATIRERRPLQLKILENCSRLVTPGGVLVYATCTTEPEENEEVIETFLSARPEFALDDPRPFLPAPAARLVDAAGFFRTFPAEPAMDGFFGARLVRKPEAG
jgi:16S rRNA (cytosine967-C5)-methyltransferase